MAKTEPKPRLIGYYNRDGYHIDEAGCYGRRLYEAGNDPLESSGHVPREIGESLRTIRRFCLQTGREMAAERGVEFAGVEREEEQAHS